MRTAQSVQTRWVTMKKDSGNKEQVLCIKSAYILAVPEDTEAWQDHKEQRHGTAEMILVVEA